MMAVKLLVAGHLTLAEKLESVYIGVRAHMPLRMFSTDRLLTTDQHEFLFYLFYEHFIYSRMMAPH